MKTIKIALLAFTLGLMSFSVIVPEQSLASNEATNYPAVVWKNETIDVGSIPQNTPKPIVFEFTNTGKTVLLITNVSGSCGCTATNYTKNPIEPGKSGSITATYNAANAGSFSKTVSVTTNVDESVKVLTIKGTVVAASTTAKS